MADSEREPLSWSQLFAELEDELRASEAGLAELDAVEGRAEAQESRRVETELRSLWPRVRELKNRLDEASEEEKARFAEVLVLYEEAETEIDEAQRFAAPEERRDDPLLLSMLKSIQFYGSIRLRLFTDVEGKTEIDDNTSRLGLRGQVTLGKDWEFFGRGEFGTNILSDISNIFAGGDPGTEAGQEGVTLPLRLAFVGFDGPWGRATFGKQWSVYYDVGVFTDQMPYFGGEAQGTYAANTDGGVAGTGRADNALQYRFAWEPIKFGLQVQLRDEGVNDRTFADTYGASAVYQHNNQFSLGAAFNRVEDGVDDPMGGQPKEGDRTAILGARWFNDDYYIAVTYSDFRQHEKDDQGRFFSGQGFEIYGDAFIWRGFGGAFTWNYQRPDNDHPGNYRLDFVTAGLGYSLGKRWKLYLLYRFDRTTLSDGSDRNDNSLGASVFFNF